MSELSNERHDDVRLVPAVTVQPREITEAVFRALCAAGADPAEAHEGALAILRLEAEEHSGLAQFTDLLDAGWRQHPPARVRTIPWDDGIIRELTCPTQPHLRWMIQLMDLGCDSPHGTVSIAYTGQACLRGPLWDDLLLRQTARVQRRIVIITSDPGTSAQESTSQLTGRTITNGRVSTTIQPDAGPALRILPHLIPAVGTAVVVMPERSRLDPARISLSPGPLRVNEQQWQTVYRAARKFLVPDA